MLLASSCRGCGVLPQRLAAPIDGPRAAPLRTPASRWRQHRGSLAASAQPRQITPYPDPFPSLEPGDELPADYGEPKPNPPKNRRAGVILHPTSLPGKYGTGEIGKEAQRFVDWLAASGMQLWQVGAAR